MRVLVSAASRYGATAEIAAAIAAELRAGGIDATLQAPGGIESVEGYDAFVLGSAVYMGHWLDEAKALLDLVRRTGGERPVWLFSSGPVGDPQRKVVQQMGVDPAELRGLIDRVEVREHKLFAGKLERGTLNRRQRAALLVMRGMEGDFRDWAQIAEWAREIAGALAPAGLAAGAR